MNRLAGALFAGDKTWLAPEPLIGDAAKGARLDGTPLADPCLIEALSALTSSLRGEASLSLLDASPLVGTSSECSRRF